MTVVRLFHLQRLFRPRSLLQGTSWPVDLVVLTPVLGQRRLEHLIELALQEQVLSFSEEEQ